MVDALERFFNWQMDMDWSWGPLLTLRPPRNVRMTLLLWLKLLGVCILFAAPLGAALSALQLYYDHTTTQHYETRIAPVVATETWLNKTPPGTVEFYGFLAVVFVFLYCFPTHWAWNRRADRLNREASLPQPALAIDAGVWPPPPIASIPADALPKK